MNSHFSPTDQQIERVWNQVQSKISPKTRWYQFPAFVWSTVGIVAVLMVFTLSYPFSSPPSSVAFEVIPSLEEDFTEFDAIMDEIAFLDEVLEFEF